MRLTIRPPNRYHLPRKYRDPHSHVRRGYVRRRLHWLVRWCKDFWHDNSI